MKRTTSGFTIIEVATVIVIMAILAGIVVVAFSNQQSGARDSVRSTRASLITDQLEKYYEENGEYPGCEAITASASIVKANTLTSLPADALLAPKAPSGVTNSVVCKPLSEIPTTQDAYSYVGNASTTCTTGPACTKWTFSWRKEQGGIGEIKSRHDLDIPAVSPGDTPVLTATAAGAVQINLTWSAVTSGTGNYEVQRSTTAGFASITTSTHTGTTAAVTGLTPSTTYYFRVRAELPVGNSSWSNVALATTAALAAPTTPTISAAMSGTNAVGTAAGGSCASGATIQREVRYQVNGGTWQAYTSSNPRSVPADQGQQYTFQARARCVAGASTTAYVESTTTSVTRPITDTPSGLTISAAVSGTNAVGTAGGGSCPTGTTIARQIRYHSSPTATAGSWSGWNDGSSRTEYAMEGHRYVFVQQARCVSTANSSIVGPWGTSSEASTVRAITVAPTGLTISAAISGTNAVGTAGGGSCPSGASVANRQIRYKVNGGAWSSYTQETPRSIAAAEGSTYTFQQQARCTTTHYTASPWGASGEAATTRTVTAPSSLTMSAAMSGTNAVGTAGGGSCASGTTIERQIQYESTPTSTAGSWSGWTAGATRTVGALQGHRYTFRQQARCVGYAASSSWATSSTSYTVRPIAAPGMPSVGNATLASKNWTWTGTSCPASTSPRYRYQFTASTGNGSWVSTTGTSATNSAATSQGINYGINVQQQCYTVHTSGSWSTSRAGGGFWVPVVHSKTAQWAIRLTTHTDSNYYVSYILKTFSGTCASGTVRDTLARTSLNSVGSPNNWINDGVWFENVSANSAKRVSTNSPDGNDTIEVLLYSRCRNTSTGYTTAANGDEYLKGITDTGNLYSRSGKYNINCAPNGYDIYCAAGYDSSGNKKTSKTSILECRQRTDAQVSTSTFETYDWTARINNGSNNPCWNV